MRGVALVLDQSRAALPILDLGDLRFRPRLCEKSGLLEH